MIKAGMKHWIAIAIFPVLVWGCTPTTGQSPLRVFGRSSPPILLSQECQGLQVKFTFERKSQTNASYSLRITDEFGQPLANITRIILAFTPLSQDDNNTVTLVAHPQPDAGTYAPKSTYAPNPGLWKVETVVRRNGKSDTPCTFTANL